MAPSAWVPAEAWVESAVEFVWTEEQEDLRTSVRRLLSRRAPLARARELAESGERYDPALWSVLAGQAGLQGIAIPPEYGGSGASLVELAVVLEEMGALLYGGPFFSTVLLAGEMLKALPSSLSRDDLLQRIASGEATATVAVVEEVGVWCESSVQTVVRGDSAGHWLRGTKEIVLDGADADAIIVAARGDDGVSLYLVDAGAPRLERERLEVLDLTRPMARVHLDDTPARLLGSGGDDWGLVEHVVRVASAMLAAEQVGAMRHLVETTADYAKTRCQFGRPIGYFQGVKHRLADMAVRLEMARSAAYWAAWQTPESPAYDVDCRVARAYCSEAFLQTARDAIQLHGGIGFTWEHDAHLFLRRARADYSITGTPPEHRASLAERIEAEVEGPTPC